MGSSKLHVQIPRRGGRQARWGRGRGVPHLDVGALRTVEGRTIEHIQIRHRAGGPQEILFGPQDDGIGFRDQTLDIEATPGGDTQPSTLAPRVEGQAFMPAERTSLHIPNEAWLFGVRRFPFYKRSIVAPADKTDFLAFLQLVRRQPEILSPRPDFRLLHTTDWKEEPREPFAVQPVEEIALVLAGIYLLVWIGAQVYTGALLRTGGKVKLRQAWKAART